MTYPPSFDDEAGCSGLVLGVSCESGFEIAVSGGCVLSALERVFRVKLVQSRGAGLES